MERLSKDVIDKNVDYKELCFYESHLLHELRRLGKERFSEKYRSEVGSLSNAVYKRYLLALLSYIDKEEKEEVPWGKYILDSRDFIFFELDGDLSDAEKRYKVALPEFLRYGFVKSEVEG